MLAFFLSLNFCPNNTDTNFTNITCVSIQCLASKVQKRLQGRSFEIGLLNDAPKSFIEDIDRNDVGHRRLHAVDHPLFLANADMRTRYAKAQNRRCLVIFLPICQMPRRKSLFHLSTQS
jgi:hypothetical protein